jgi:uncharacterized membrane protein YccC
MMAAVACSLFAAFDDPAPFIISFANAAIAGAVCAGLYLFAVLPLASNFEMLALDLAPWLIACGLFMAQPKTAPFATGVAVNGATMIAIQNGPLGDFAPFANSAIALIVGMWCAALIVRLVRSVGGSLERAPLATDQSGEPGEFRDARWIGSRSRACCPHARPSWFDGAEARRPAAGGRRMDR